MGKGTKVTILRGVHEGHSATIIRSEIGRRGTPVYVVRFNSARGNRTYDPDWLMPRNDRPVAQGGMRGRRRTADAD